MFSNTTNERHSRFFDSVGEMIESCDRAYKEGRRVIYGGGWASESSFIGRSFTDWKDVVKKANEHWQEGLDTVQQMLWAIEGEGYSLPPPVDRRRRRAWADSEGDDIDLDRLRGGQEYWQTTKRTLVQSPQYISLVCNFSTRCNVDSDLILWRGATAIVITDMLEKAGYRVDLHVVNTVRNGYQTPKRDAFIALNLKRPEDPLDISTVVNAVSGWFFRTVLFQAYFIPKTLVPDSALGGPKLLDAKDEDIQKLAGGIGKTVLIDNVWSLKASLNLVKETIEKANSGLL